MSSHKREMLELYRNIEKLIERLDFNLIYPGFTRYNFALYNEKIVVFKDLVIPHDQRFTGNTAIIYEGEYIAIWQVETFFLHYHVLASKIVHEMFHAWQFSQGEKRFPNEFIGLGYLYEKYNIALKYDETKMLLKAFEEEDKEALDKFVAYREKRRRDYVNELFYEEGIETIEGMAKFVELEALKQLDTEEYLKAYEALKKAIKNIRNYIPIRNISYEIGALILMTAQKFNMSFVHDIKNEEKPIYDLLFSDFNKESIFYENNNLDLSFLEKYYESIGSRINYVLMNNPKVHKCDKVIGFDPLNSFRIDRYVYYRHFVMIESDNQQLFIANESIGEVNEYNQVFLIYEKTIR
ncbi:MAG: hypothetical protein AB7S96_04490 [Candidatus Izemoplasmatales bacterium]